MIKFETSCNMCRTYWQAQKGKTLPELMVFTHDQQVQNEAMMLEAIHQMKASFQLDKLNSFDTWRQELDDKIKNMLKDEQILYMSWLSEEEQASFLQITRLFIKDAREFDKEMSLEDIGQAMRNVWIFILLEKMFNLPLQYHKAIFAYSMLYPYTDNFLDDEFVSLQEKQDFNDWLTRRLQGEENLCIDENVKHIHQLIEMIEEIFPRECYASVYDALLLIQQGQIKSLLQTQDLDWEMIERISIEKGAASVIADGMLIQGEMNDLQYQFCVEYGYMLQIADDIQDQIEDDRIHHHTLASILTMENERVELANQLLQYIQDVLLQRCPNKEKQVQACIIQNCTQLLVSSVLKHPDLYPTSYIQQLNRHMPFQSTFLDDIKRQEGSMDMDEEQFMMYLDMYVDEAR